jgi:TPR repeat protein
MNQLEISDLIQRAEEDDIDSQVELGARYASGDGVSKNQELAIQWYTKAAASESSEAQYNLALMYLFGEGVEQSKKIAIELLDRAASNGSSDACLVLGEVFELGTLEFDVDYFLAAKCYVEAFRLGSPKGIQCLGSLIERGLIDLKVLGNMMSNYELGAFSIIRGR